MKKELNNVIDLFKPRPKKKTESDFIQTIDKNLKNKKRLEEERKINNKKTLRQYSIKK